jgi:hypothetical protein
MPDEMPGEERTSKSAPDATGVTPAGHAACIFIQRAWSPEVQPGIDSVDARRFWQFC